MGQWISGGLPIKSVQIRDIYSDTLNDRLFVAGSLPLDSSGSSATSSIWFLDRINQNWGVIDTISGLVLAQAIFNNDLYIGGSIQSINGVTANHLVKWDGTVLSPFGNPNTQIMSLKVIDNELYVTGWFSEIGGVQAQSIAKFDGSNWHSLNFPDFGGSFAQISDVVKYNGELYVGGNFSIAADSIYDMAVYRNGNWQRVGTNDYMRGGFNDVWSLAVFEGELYAGGSIYKSAGNVGYGIQRWDGYNWKELGTGIRDLNYSTNGTLQVRQLTVYEDKLYICGGFSYAGDEPSYGLATWDGNYWCGNSQFTSDSFVDNFTIFQDTLYIGNQYDSIQGVHTNKFAKWGGGVNFQDVCSLPMSINSISEVSVEAYPNPTDGLISLQLNTSDEVQINIYDISGKLIYINKIIPTNNFINIDLTQYAKGSYVLNVSNLSKNLNKVVKILKQ